MEQSMAVLVEQVTVTKSGKAYRVLLGGKWYNAFIDSGINNAVGKYIEAEITTSEKYGPGISKWTYSNAAPQGQSQAGTPPPGHSPSGPAAAAPYDERNPPPETHERRYAEPSDNIQPWYMPFVSNTVAHAIEKGLIQSPVGINEWALKAAQVAAAVKESVK